jgi:Calcineurin-like phosphoesterase
MRRICCGTLIELQHGEFQMDDFEPFLQIVHISDLHVIDPRSSNAVAVRGRIRGLRGVSTGIAEWIADGTAPHDNLAVPLFKEFLKEVTKDPEWAECKAWLVDTGDLTSLGDQGSLDLGCSYLNEFVTVCPDVGSTYGNHDAWPGKLPLFAAGGAITAQSQVLSARQYVVASPRCPLSTTIPRGAGQVQLYFVDSIIHDRWKNTMALGEISTNQLSALQSLVDQNFDAKRHDFRILAVHHPVHYPPPRPHNQMAMRNDKNVAAVLDTPSPAGAYPLAHLVLSGHTHYLYPPHGELPRQASLCIHPPLGSDQCQLVVGSLMQLDRYNKRLGWPHQCQILRLYCSKSTPSVISVERLLVARQAGRNYRGTGIGPYKFVPLAQESQQIAEEISFAV